MSKRLPYNKRERRAMSQYYGRRPTNNWGSGDLPAPWCPGDICEVHPDAYALSNGHGGKRIDYGPGMYVVSTVFSIDEGDAWYMRVANHEGGSDRLHVAYEGRCAPSWDGLWCDWMAGITLVDTIDPEGLAKREAMLAAGWTMNVEFCECCGRQL